jgi:hypothetical protein
MTDKVGLGYMWQAMCQGLQAIDYENNLGFIEFPCQFDLVKVVKISDAPKTARTRHNNPGLVSLQ